MSAPQIVQSAQAAPGTCILSGDNEGPFIDTGRTIRRHGRVYLSLKHLGPLLRANGWLTTEEAADLHVEARNEARKARELSERVRKLDDLIEAIKPFVPAPEPVTNTVVQREPRDITDSDVQDFLERNPTFIEQYRPAPKGSTAEWNKLYRNKPASKAAPAPVEDPESPAGDASGGEEPAATFEVHGQEVNLDDVLSHKVAEITDFAEGHEGLAHALAVREEWRAKQAGREPRKTVLALHSVTE